MNTTSSSTATHYLRIEGVNLDRFVLDTRDLSTVRGGGLLLLNAIPKALEALKPYTPRVLSQGASSGLFEITTNTPDDAANAVRNTLLTDKSWKHATFVVDVVPIATTFRDDLESVLAANRWRQMQASSLAIPSKNNATGMAKPACALDGFRPAVNHPDYGAPNRGNDKESFISEPVFNRRKFGWVAKQKFYKRIIERVAERDTDAQCKATLNKLANTPLAFAEDFETIANKKGSPLDGKLAVFYADGNNFGKKQTTYCKSPEHQIAFDEFLRFRREAFLADFLQTETTKEEWKNGEEIRFEILLWGGDEVMFVMPAALGLRFASFFFEKLGGLNLNQAKLADDSLLAADEPLTHAAALVFCQHHAPIDRIKRLAKDQMAEFTKKTDRTRDSLVAVALESFDHLGGDYKSAIKQRVNKCCAPAELIISATPQSSLSANLKTIAEKIDTLNKSDFPRSQLRTSVLDFINGNRIASDAKAHDQLLKRLSKDTKEVRDALDQLRPCFASNGAFWFHLEELWDYAKP